jgi:hypothetical protein
MGCDSKKLQSGASLYVGTLEPSSLMVIESRGVRETGDIALMEKMRNSFT